MATEFRASFWLPQLGHPVILHLVEVPRIGDRKLSGCPGSARYKRISMSPCVYSRFFYFCFPRCLFSVVFRSSSPLSKDIAHLAACNFPFSKAPSRIVDSSKKKRVRVSSPLPLLPLPIPSPKPLPVKKKGGECQGTQVKDCLSSERGTTTAGLL